MPDDPDDLLRAVSRVEDAFSGQLGALDYEEALDPRTQDVDVIQLRKACRLLDSCRVLRDRDGYHTSVIELSFGAIERTFEFYALTASNDTIDDFREGHDRAYDRGAALGVVTTEMARRLKQLYRENRAAAYYRDTVAADQQADAMFELAVYLHDYVTDFAQMGHECRCARR